MSKFPHPNAADSGPPPSAAEASVRETAAQWIARRRSGLSPAAAQEFDEWRSADPGHAAALAELESVWALVNRPRLSGRSGVVRRGLVSREQHRRSARRGWVSLGLGLAAAAALYFVVRPPPAISLSPPTVALRPNRQTLADGSTVELNAGAEIAVDFEPAQRNVQLVRGEALFHVAKNPSRPFVVSAGGVAVRAVGTAFSVRYDSTQVGVLVTEGKVQVDPAATRWDPARGEPVPAGPRPSAARTLVFAGQKATVTLAPGTDEPRATRVVPVTGADIDRALAWRRQRVEFTNTPLAEAVQWFNRENRVQIVIVDPILERRRITGIFWSDDPDGFVRLLQSGVGTEAERSGTVLKLRAR